MKSTIKMKYDVMLRSRANPDEPYEAKHMRFFDRLREMPEPWGIKGHLPPSAPDCGRDIGAGVRFGRLLGKGIQAQVMYWYRHSHLAEDLGMNDDFVMLSFNPEKVDYLTLVREALPAYIEAFDGYLLQVKDDEFFDADFAQEQELKINYRHFVYRIYPVSYYDRELCRRGFNLTPEQIAGRLAGSVEEVRLIHDGVYLIGSSRALPLAEADELSRNMKRWITSN